MNEVTALQQIGEVMGASPLLLLVYAEYFRRKHFNGKSSGNGSDPAFKELLHEQKRGNRLLQDLKDQQIKLSSFLEGMVAGGRGGSG